jgi:DNA-binding CsgD family transcriptional regulator
MIQDMEIIIDRARNDGVLSQREYRMLVSRRTGGTYRRMAEDEGMSPGGVYKIIEAAVAKIRLAYRTAE